VARTSAAISVEVHDADAVDALGYPRADLRGARTTEIHLTGIIRKLLGPIEGATELITAVTVECHRTVATLTGWQCGNNLILAACDAIHIGTGCNSTIPGVTERCICDQLTTGLQVESGGWSLY